MFHGICYNFSVEMFIFSPPDLWLGSSLLLNYTGMSVSCRAQRKKGGRERERKSLVWWRKPFNNFPWKLKEEIVLGWIAVGGDEAHMRTR